MKHRLHPSHSPTLKPSARRGRPVEPDENDHAVVRAARAAARDKDTLADVEGAGLPLGMQKTHEVDAKSVRKNRDKDTFSEDAIGGLDPDPVAGGDNPQGTQTGRGPLNQNDQGNRQNAEADELENIVPDLDPYKWQR